MSSLSNECSRANNLITKVNGGGDLVTPLDLPPGAAGLHNGTAELYNGGATLALSGPDNFKTFLIGVAGGTASGKVGQLRN